MIESIKFVTEAAHLLFCYFAEGGRMFVRPSTRRIVGVVISIVIALLYAPMAVAQVSSEEPGEPDLPASEDEVVTVDPSEDPGVLSLMQSEGISRSEAVKRIRWQTEAAGPLYNGLVRNPAYGGMWAADEEDGRIQIGYTGANRGIENVVNRSPIAAGVDLVKVERSYTTLLRVSENLAERAAAFSDPQVFEGGLDVSANVARLSVREDAQDRDDVVAFVDAVKRDFGDAVRVEQHAGNAFAAVGCSKSGWQLYCDPSLRGGVRLNNTRTGGFCSAGFMARSRSDSKRYVLTAGHCYKQKPTVKTKLKNRTTVRTIGNVHNAEFNGATEVDAAIVRINDTSYWKPRGLVAVRSSSDKNGVPGTTKNDKYPIKRRRSAQQGWRVCTTGTRTGTECGKVTDPDQFLCYEWDWPSPKCIAHLKRTNQRALNRGDSGGSTYAGNNAYGIFVAYNPVTNNRFFMDIFRAQDAMNVNILLE